MRIIDRRRRRTHALTRTFAAAAAAALALALAACGASSSGEGTGDPGTPQRGGSVKVLLPVAHEGGWAGGLDPATNPTGGSNLPQMQAIFGGLFLLRADDDGDNARVVPNQARSYQLSDGGRTLTIRLRPGITFSDGTPMDAAAVAWNFRRDIGSPCSCAPTWELAKGDPIRTPDDLTVVVHLARPNGALISNFTVSNVNWIASPTALRKLGTARFKVAPVGAGPFVVKSDQLSSELVLERNPHYFRKGLPYLDTLTFTSIEGDQPGYQVLQSGQAQGYIGMATVSILEQAKENPDLQVTPGPPTSPYFIQLNTMAAPFDDIRARKAIYYATDFQAIADGIFDGAYPVSESFTAPGGLFHHAKVPGYLHYDLDKAKQLVQELGGLTVHLGTSDDQNNRQLAVALQTQWEKAGMKVEVSAYQLQPKIQQYTAGTWQAMVATAGSWDPAAGIGVIFRFASDSAFTGVKDPRLDRMLDESVATTDPDKRDAIYQQMAAYVAKQAYGPFGIAFSPANVAVKGVYGPGLTTPIPAMAVDTAVVWDEVWTNR